MKAAQSKPGSDTVIIGSKPYETLWAQFQAAYNHERPAGDGWKSAREIAKMIGRCARQARESAEKKVAQGAWERIQHVGARGQLQNFYRPIIKK